MTVQFNILTDIQEHTALLKNISPEERALLLHLQRKLNQAFTDADYQEAISCTLNVLPE